MIYRDYSGELEKDSRFFSPQGLLMENEIKVPRGAELVFPVKLHHMLSDVEEQGLSHIVSWQPHGRCFVVHDTKGFVDRVLPSWFKMTKFASLQRQLNLYGFQRITSGRDKGGYYHELFLRGRRFLAHRIHRIKLKGTGVRKPASPETEPNFYLMPFVTTTTSPASGGTMSAPVISATSSPAGGGTSSRTPAFTLDALLRASLVSSGYLQRNQAAFLGGSPLMGPGGGVENRLVPSLSLNQLTALELGQLLRPYEVNQSLVPGGESAGRVAADILYKRF